MTNHYSGLKADGSPVKILLVEDNYLVAMHLQVLLEEDGYEVLGPYATPEETLEALTDMTIDGALLDFSLRNGANSVSIANELIRRGREFIFITGLGGVDEIPSRFSHVRRLNKPFQEVDVLEAVATFGSSGSR